MNKLPTLFAPVFTAAMLFCNLATAAVPPIEGTGAAAITACPTPLAHETAFYSDKIVFKITGPLTAHLPEDQAKLNKLPRFTELDIKIRDNPNRIANIKSKVLTFLGAQPNATNAGYIEIGDILYTAIVCSETP